MIYIYNGEDLIKSFPYTKNDLAKIGKTKDQFAKMVLGNNFEIGVHEVLFEEKAVIVETATEEIVLTYEQLLEQAYKAREVRYKNESDPIKMEEMYKRENGLIEEADVLKSEWIAKVEQIKSEVVLPTEEGVE